jgi:hypothetical protein
MPELNVNKLDLKTFKEVLVELMTRNALPDEIYELIIAPKLLKLLDQIAAKIFTDWWRPPIALPYFMAALDEKLGTSVLEIQGRVAEDKIKWMKIYGVKGAEEKDKVRNWQKENGQ